MVQTTSKRVPFLDSSSATQPTLWTQSEAAKKEAMSNDNSIASLHPSMSLPVQLPQPQPQPSPNKTIPLPPPPPPPLSDADAHAHAHADADVDADRTGKSATDDSSFAGTATTATTATTSSSTTVSDHNTNAHQKRSPPGPTRSRNAGNRVPPPPPPPPLLRKVPPPPPPPRRTIGSNNNHSGSNININISAPPKRRRPIANPVKPKIPPPPPPPPPKPPQHKRRARATRMYLNSSEELASKAKEMFHTCLNRSIPTGNLYSGGLGAYYLLLEQSRYHSVALEKQQMLEQSRRDRESSIIGNSNSTIPMNSRIKYSHTTPFRCKRLLKEALEGARTATDRFKKRSKSSNLSHQRSCISLLGGEWVGSHALLAVCYRRLEDFQKKEEGQEEDQQQQQHQDHHHASYSGQNHRAISVGRNPGDDNTTVSSISSPTAGRKGAAHGTSLFSRKTSQTSISSMASGGGASVVSNGTATETAAMTVATTTTTTTKPKSEQVVDKIFYKIEKQHLAADEDDDNMTYYTFNSNYTNNTLSSMVNAPVWNQDVLGGRAGALQAIWWLRKEFREPSMGQDLAVSLAVKILDEGLATAASMGFHQHSHEKTNMNMNSSTSTSLEDDYNYDDDDDCYDPSAILVWVCDNRGTHKAYLGAARGVVGILHTLLGLSNGDWELVEEQVPNARSHARHTIDVFCAHTRSSALNRASNYLASIHETSIATATTTTAVPVQVLPNAETKRKALLLERFLYNGASDKPGNLRPRLDAPSDSDTTVDWCHGATGLAMLFLEASKVFRSKEYLQEAHRICDAVVYPRGLAEQQQRPQGQGLRVGSATTGGGATSTSNSKSRMSQNKYNKKGPVGLAGMAVCFLQLSQLCSNDEIEITNENGNTNANATITLNGTEHEAGGENEEPTTVPKPSLKKLWKTRAALYAQQGHQEWATYMKAIPATTGSGNVYSLYEGMGGLISLLWQLSLSTVSAAEESTDLEALIGVQLPLYGLGCLGSSAINATTGENSKSDPILISYEDVTLLETAEEILRPMSPPKLRRNIPVAGNSNSSKQALAEARRRAAQAEEAERMREQRAKADRAAQRRADARAEIETRKKAKDVAQKKALEAARQKDLEESTQKEAEARIKREAVLLARKQAKERVDAKRKAKEEEELARAATESQRKAIDAENQRKTAEEETKKRRALAEARLRRQKKEAVLSKQREEERRQAEEVDRLWRAEALKIKEEQRRVRLAELRLRQLRAAEIAKEKEKERLVKEEADREKREKELKLREEVRKKQDAERRRRLELYKEKRKKEEQGLAKEKAKQEQQRKLAGRKALEAKEKRRLELQRIRKQKELEEKRLRKELQQALDKEIEKQRLEEEQFLPNTLEEEGLNMEDALNAILDFASTPPPHHTTYSPSFAERKVMDPAHFSVPTNSSLFWSLQTDSNIGSSDSYKPALVHIAADDSQPSSEPCESAESPASLPIDGEESSSTTALGSSAITQQQQQQQQQHNSKSIL